MRTSIPIYSEAVSAKSGVKQFRSDRTSGQFLPRDWPSPGSQPLNPKNLSVHAADKMSRIREDLAAILNRFGDHFDRILLGILSIGSLLYSTRVGSPL